MRYAIVHPSFAVRGGTEVLLAHLSSELVRRGHGVTIYSSGTAASASMQDLDGRVGVVEIETGPEYADALSLRDWSAVGARLAPHLLQHDVLTFHGIPSPLWWRGALAAEPALANAISLWSCHGLVGWLHDDVAGKDTQSALGELGRGGDRTGARLALARLGVVQERGLRWTLSKVARMTRGGRGDARPAIRDAEREAVRSFTRVIANSHFTASCVSEIYGVESTVCYPGLARDAIPDRRSDPGSDLLTVARLQFSKNHRGMLRAVAELKRLGTVPFRRYVIVGDGVELDDLRRLVGALGIEDLVEFAGHATGRDLDGFYERAGVFALPAFDEGFGLVYLEASIRARASIAPNRGGPAEIVLDGETGWLVDPFDTQQIADTILRAFSDRDELRRRGEAAHARLLDEFTVERHADCFEIASRPRGARL